MYVIMGGQLNEMIKLTTTILVLARKLSANNPLSLIQ